MKEVTIVGWINNGKPADCGETMKNQLIIKKLEEMGVRCRPVDFKGWKRRPWVFIQFAWNLFIHKKSTLILSTSPQNIYFLMKIMKKIGWKQNTIHWVIGGNLGDKIEQGIYKPEVLGYMQHTLVESPVMVRQLEAAGIRGVKEVPNFKPIVYRPEIRNRYPGTGRELRFVFLSRVMPEKGCDYILAAARMLETKGYGDKFSVDFYGKIAEDYEKIFLSQVDNLHSVAYKGFLDLTGAAGYDELSGYDVMLFPTYWKGEGFPGILIDAFTCGLPVIASEWAHNRIFLEEGRTALFVPVHDADALCDKMRQCIDGDYDIYAMAQNCQKQCDYYDVDKVITKKLLQEIGVM